MASLAVVWTYWISYALVGLAVLGIIATFIGYLVKVVAARGPRQ